MNEIFVADAHCDTAGEMYRKFNLYESSSHFDLKRLSGYSGYLQVFAIWTDPKKDVSFIRKRFYETAQNLKHQAEKNKKIFFLAKSKADIEYSIRNYKYTGIISVEGGEILGADESFINILYENGVRCLTLTWNYKNNIGCGAGCETDTGLSEFGKRVIKKLDEKGILTDLSHASEKTFWDSCEYTHNIMVTHSNARKLCEHKRNITDEQIKHLIKANGFAGINYYPPFLREGGKADVSDIIKHIEYFMALGAKDILGLGSDFDGMDIIADGIEGAQSVYKIADELLKLNYSEEKVKKIMGENLINFFMKRLK